MLMDKLELSSSAVKELVQANFGGTLQYQMISKDCHHTSVRDEPFLMLTAEVCCTSLQTVTSTDTLSCTYLVCAELYCTGESQKSSSSAQTVSDSKCHVGTAYVRESETIECAQ
jgi:hypothetical protein